MITKHEAQIIGNIGMFNVCYRLSRHGWNAMPTTRNAREIDIIAYSPDGKHFHGIQIVVKVFVSPAWKDARQDWGRYMDNCEQRGLGNALHIHHVARGGQKEGTSRGERRLCILLATTTRLRSRSVSGSMGSDRATVRKACRIQEFRYRVAL